ncbi:glycerate kinase [Robiginitalea myxolifaciens]|uniref:Glycerate kinase n=1 Tax=Robiginitalea myxolifaciens TaxID=400055 RepID=A0A1I6H5G6_9FLAO|nr:glycerate kinase [Robiginitalea myxolifaciens]SFR49630.1 glycerate kinase [Robiginitalea myxolifaciens]
MRVLLLPDKFKGSLTAAQVSDAVVAGIRKTYPKAETPRFAASDGGDGFLEAVGAIRTLETISLRVPDPMGRPVEAVYLFDPESGTAFVEMAQASGLVLLEPHERNPLLAHTEGTGRLIADALSRGATEIYVGLGGSATSDGGMGLAHAVGYRFFDREGNLLSPSGQNLERIERIDAGLVSDAWKACQIYAVNDVNNPLYGENGAAYVYAPQKGADPDMVGSLDQGLRNLDRVVQQDLGNDTAQTPGCGAAGGTAYGLKVFLEAAFLGGAQYILRQTGAEAALASDKTDFIVTGEGSLDAQSLQGKWIQAVVDLGKQFNTPVVAVCGRCTLGAAEWKAAGLHTVLEVGQRDRPLAWNMENAAALTEAAVANYFEGL